MTRNMIKNGFGREATNQMTRINQIRKNSKIMEFECAVDVSVTYCIKHNGLKTFLLKHRAEVKDVCLTEYEEKTFVDGIRAAWITQQSYNTMNETLRRLIFLNETTKKTNLERTSIS